MINVGDIVVLRDSAYVSEFNKFNWSEKYLYEDAFKSVSLRFKNLDQFGERAKTYFGGTQSRIEAIEYMDDNIPVVILTDIFDIFYSKAIEEREIQIIPYNGSNYNPIKADRDLVNDLEYFEQMYLDKIFSIGERENNKRAMYEIGLYKMIQQKKWQP